MLLEADLVLEDEENGRQIANGGIFIFFGKGGREKKGIQETEVRRVRLAWQLDC